MTDNSTPVKNSSGGRRTPVPQLSQSTLNSSQGLYLLHFFLFFKMFFVLCIRIRELKNDVKE